MEDTPSLAEAILEQIADAVIFADATGTIRRWNRAAAALFGYSAAEALGQNLDLIIPERLRAAHWDGWRRVIETGQSRYRHGDLLSVPAIRKDGQRISVEFTIVPLKDETGRMIGMAALIRDVTKRFEEMKALRRQLAAAGPVGRATGK